MSTPPPAEDPFVGAVRRQAELAHQRDVRGHPVVVVAGDVAVVAVRVAVVAGALLWSGVQARWVWTRELYYVTPPSPPSVTPPEVPRSDPEKPAPRG